MRNITRVSAMTIRNKTTDCAADASKPVIKKRINGNIEYTIRFVDSPGPPCVRIFTCPNDWNA